MQLAYNQFQDYQEFCYDGRSDIRDSGARLLQHLKDNKPVGGRWRLVGHSQGGLLMVVASKLYSEESGGSDTAFSDLVAGAVLLASPLSGTLKSVDALVNAENLGGGFKERFRKIAGTWPALFQMLPTWRGCVRRPGLPGVAPVDYNLMDPRAWEGHDVDEGMLKRARHTRQRFLRNPISRMKNVDIRIVMSLACNTWNHVTQEDGRLVFNAEYEEGDTLVPYHTTRAQMKTAEREVSHGFGEDQNTAPHYLLADDPAIAAYVRDFLAE